MSIRESTIEKSFCAYAKSKGCLTYKFVSPGRRGVPDRLFVTPTGTVMFLEVKAPGKQPNPLQIREMHKLRERGVAVFWCDSVDECKECIDMVI